MNYRDNNVTRPATQITITTTPNILRIYVRTTFLDERLANEIGREIEWKYKHICKSTLSI